MPPPRGGWGVDYPLDFSPFMLGFLALPCPFSPFMLGFLAPGLPCSSCLPSSSPPHSHLHMPHPHPHPHTHAHTHSLTNTHTHTHTLASRRKAKLCSVPVHQEPSRTVDQAPSAREGASAFKVWAKLLGQPKGWLGE